MRVTDNLPDFDLVGEWEQLPPGYPHRDVTAVAVDSHDHVYLFTRFDSRVLVYEPDGRFIRAWGHDIFHTAHGLTIGPDDRVFCVDAGDHSVRVFTLEGEPLMTIGIPGVESDTGYDWAPGKPVDVHPVECVLHGAGPFNRCTNLAVAPTGELFVSDGYGNCRVHRFSAQGDLIASWGEVGSGPGEFRLPHGILVDHQGRVLVADRENDRIQLFDYDGNFLDQWTDIQRPCDMAIDAEGRIYVAELWRPKGKKSFVHGVAETDQPGRVSILSPDGRPLARWTGRPDDRAAPGSFVAPHGITVDSRGAVYVAEVVYSFAVAPGWLPPEAGDHQIQKFRRRQAL
jgi:hypothetical protein